MKVAIQLHSEHLLLVRSPLKPLYDATFRGIDVLASTFLKCYESNFFSFCQLLAQLDGCEQY